MTFDFITSEIQIINIQRLPFCPVERNSSVTWQHCSQIIPESMTFL